MLLAFLIVTNPHQQDLTRVTFYPFWIPHQKPFNRPSNSDKATEIISLHLLQLLWLLRPLL